MQTSPVNFLKSSLIVAGFNLIVAFGLKISNPNLGTLPGVILYSQCIGLIIYSLYTLAEHTLLPGDGGLRVAGRVAIAAPLGYTLGSWVSATVLGEPVQGLIPVDVPRFELVVTVLATICVAYFMWSRDRLHEEAAARARAQQLALETQLKLLRAQIEPHMLFNTLANLRTLVEIDPQRAQQMLDQLILFLRGTLGASRTEQQPLFAEFAHLQAYLLLMQVRMGTRLSFALDLEDSVKDCLVPSMLLQPLVENAIKHGLEPAIAGGTLSVSAQRTAAGLQLQVLDSGIGMSRSAELEGYGLTHVRERLHALYGQAARLDIRPAAPHGVLVRIDLPLGESR